MNSIVTGAKSIALKGVTKLKKFSPEILLGVGAAGILTGVVLACIETTKIDPIIDEHLDIREKIKDAIDADIEEYTKEDEKKDIAKLYFKTGTALAKNYAPAAAVLTTSFVCLFSSYGIMKKRSVSIIAAYNALSSAFDAYRDRVKEAIGEDKERDIRFGAKQVSVEEYAEDENGKKTKTKKKEKILPDDPNQVSQYAKFFDEMNPNWTKNSEHNLNFLKMTQNWANDLLNARGHVFLNEVYDMLGIPRTSAGQAVGWTKNNGDGYIDFGIYDGYRASARDFVNGYERSILLDFNVDGVIWENI